MAMWIVIASATLLTPPGLKPRTSTHAPAGDLKERREALVSTLAREREAIAKTEHELAALDKQLAPLSCDIDDVMAPRGYLSKVHPADYLTGYSAGGATGPPPSAMTLALDNFGRELKELVTTILPGQTTGASKRLAESSNVYAGALDSLTLDNDIVWAREEALLEGQGAVPAPLLIKLPYLFICNTLDKLYDGSDGRRVLAKFWYLETVARVPYFGYNTMITLYETMGWWRLSSDLKQTHFKEDENEFAHLLIMEALGGDQLWFDRFIGQHSALIYYAVITIMWLISPTLAYNFSELIETHAVVTYSEFVDQNEATLKELPPPAVALEYYNAGGLNDNDAPIESLYDVFCRIRDDEGSHVDSMKECQDPDVRSRARIVEVASIATAATIFATSAFTVETVEMEIFPDGDLDAVQQFEKRVQQQVVEEIGEIEARVEGAVQKEEADFLERFVEKQDATIFGGSNGK